MDIKDRIRVIIEKERLTQVAFSEVTGIKPAALNHVLTGRNNASREVIDRILVAFPQYEEDWLVLGQGPVFTEQAKAKLQDEKTTPLFPDYVPSDTGKIEEKKNMVNRESATPSHIDAPQPLTSSFRPKRIAKIIVYYTDNTFETLLPSD